MTDFSDPLQHFFSAPCNALQVTCCIRVPAEGCTPTAGKRWGDLTAAKGSLVALQAPRSAAAAEHECVQGLWVSQLPHVSLNPQVDLLLSYSRLPTETDTERSVDCCRVEAAARANGNPTQASPVTCESLWLES